MTDIIYFNVKELNNWFDKCFLYCQSLNELEQILNSLKNVLESSKNIENQYIFELNLEKYLIESNINKFEIINNILENLSIYYGNNLIIKNHFIEKFTKIIPEKYYIEIGEKSTSSYCPKTETRNIIFQFFDIGIYKKKDTYLKHIIDYYYSFETVRQEMFHNLDIINYLKCCKNNHIKDYYNIIKDIVVEIETKPDYIFANTLLKESYLCDLFDFDIKNVFNIDHVNKLSLKIFEIIHDFTNIGVRKILDILSKFLSYKNIGVNHNHSKYIINLIENNIIKQIFLCDWEFEKIAELLNSILNKESNEFLLYKIIKNCNMNIDNNNINNFVKFFDECEHKSKNNQYHERQMEIFCNNIVDKIFLKNAKITDIQKTFIKHYFNRFIANNNKINDKCKQFLLNLLNKLQYNQ